MTYSSITQLIIEAGDDAFFVGKANEQRIFQIECDLGVTLPESYKWFLREFGHGGLSGAEILGNGIGKIPSCVTSTKGWRHFGLPSNLVVIEDEGMGWIYCLDTSRIIAGESPVVDWEMSVGIGHGFFESFLKFFEARIKGIC